MHNWENIFATGSITLLSLTVTLLLVNFKEGRYSFLALAFYLFQILIINLIAARVIPAPLQTERYLVFCHNLLDAPLMLLGLVYFTNAAKTKKLLFYLIGAFIIFEFVVFLFTGLHDSLLTVIIGPGLIMVTALSCYFFFNHVKSSFTKRKDMGKAFISGGLVFAYACFNFMYIVDYVMNNPNHDDIMKIYHLTYIIASLTISIGLLIIMREKRKKPVIEPKIKQEDINAFQYL